MCFGTIRDTKNGPALLSEDWSGAFESLLGGKKTLVVDPEFMCHAFDPSEIGRRNISPNGRFELLLGEAQQALTMIEPYLYPGVKVLELGGGVGLVHALLRSRGVDIISLEPGAEGFGDRHRAGLYLLNLLGVDPGGWLKMVAEDLPEPEKPFDLVFSYFVLEHIRDLDQAFKGMVRVLAKDGVMVHRCPNYVVPFEPHYNIPLVPFRPELTALLWPGLSRRPLWRDLQFTTRNLVERLCARHMLLPTFRRGMAAWAFDRVLSDPLFASRKQGFLGLARFLRSMGLLGMLRRLPPGLDTPMEFSATKMLVKS